MKIKELVEYMRKTPHELSQYCQRTYGFCIPEVETADIEERYLIIAPHLNQKEKNKLRRELKQQDELKAGRSKVSKFVSDFNDGRWDKTIESIENAAESKLIRYEQELAEYILRDKPVAADFWENICKLAEKDWKLLRRMIHGLLEDKSYFEALLKLREDIIINLLITYIDHSSIKEAAFVIYMFYNIIEISMINIYNLVSSKLNTTNDYDDFIEELGINWEQMVDFLILCDSRNSIYVLARNLLNKEVQNYYKWKQPTNTEIRGVISRIMKECTIYPEIAYIVQALSDACSREMENKASDYLDDNSVDSFWNHFYEERDNELKFIKADMDINESYIVKVEENYVIVRFANQIAKIDKKDLFYAPVKDLRYYYKANDTISDLVVKSVTVENDINTRYRKWNILLKGNHVWKEKYVGFVSNNKGKPIKADILQVTQGGILVSLGYGVETMLKREHMLPHEYNNISKLNANFPQLEIVIKGFDIEEKTCDVRCANQENMDEIWDEIELFYKQNCIYTGKVFSKEKDYYDIELQDFIKVRVYKNEFDWNSGRINAGRYKVGDQVKVLILNIDKDKRRMKGSFKRVTPNPWEIASESIRTGETCMVKVIDVTDYNLIVETVDTHRLVGQIKKSELTWNQQEETKLPKIGTQLKAKVILFDPNNYKIRLSVKQLSKDPWDELHIGNNVLGTVTKREDNGVATVLLNSTLEARTSDFEPNLQEGKTYPFKIIGCNRTEQTIVLSNREYLFDQQAEKIVSSFFKAKN